MIPLNPALTKALAARGYETLTPVQEAVSDPALAGQDLLVSAQTGSGKTVGFGIAISPTLLGGAEEFEEAASPLALIIAPTRELALQVKRELSWLYGEAGVRMASCVGGMDMRDERRALARGAHIVVATPGRLRDHIQRESIDLSEIRAVVLDEADEMLDLGFREDLEFILSSCPEHRQTLLFSATVPPAIAGLAKSYQNDAERITVKSAEKQHSDIEYHAVEVHPADSESAIINLLRLHEAPNAIVFCNTRMMVSRMTTRLSNRGFAVVALSGELTQSERANALQSMRDGRARVCVATDVAARGIDLPNLDLVIHAELPTGSETLLHRSGRTGRAGRKGVSALIVPQKMRRKAERLLKWAKLSAQWIAAPSADEVRAADRVRLMEDTLWSEEPTEAETTVAAELLEKHTPEALALAVLRMYASKHSAPEEIRKVTPEAPKERKPFGPSRWFSLELPKNERAEVRRILPMLCKAGDVSRDDFGAIRLMGPLAYVEVSEASVEGFMDNIGPDMTVEDSAQLTLLDEVPEEVLNAKKPERKTGGKFGDKRGGGKFGGKREGGRDGGKPWEKRDRDEAPRDRKPRAKKTWDDAPKERDFDDKPRSEKPRREKSDRDDNSSKKKPKARPGKHGHKPAKPGDKPARKGAGDAGKSFRKPRPEDSRPEGVVKERKPRHKKGPPPPAGKPNSKKNKARRAEQQGKGGNARPTRKS